MKYILLLVLWITVVLEYAHINCHYGNQFFELITYNFDLSIFCVCNCCRIHNVY